MDAETARHSDRRGAEGHQCHAVLTADACQLFQVRHGIQCVDDSRLAVCGSNSGQLCGLHGFSVVLFRAWEKRPETPRGFNSDGHPSESGLYRPAGDDAVARPGGR